jgi:hypothetical protein
MSIPASSNVPDWFWQLLDSSRPILQDLAAKLEVLPREELVAYAATYERAVQSLCDAWAGPEVDGIQFSEDDTEDLCRWVVSEGQELYVQAVALQGRLASIVPRYWASERGDDREHPSWSVQLENEAYRGHQSPRDIVYAIYEARFGASLHDDLERRDVTPSKT